MTAGTLLLANVPADWDGRRYRPVASNAAGTTSGTPGRLSVSAAATAWANRVLPGSYVGGRAFEVLIDARPAASVAFHAVVDRPPAGWIVSAINEGGTLDATKREVKFGPFSDGAARQLRYTVLPPANATGRFEFIGVASADGVPFVIGGAGFIENSVSHPADLNADLQLAVDEVTAYGAAWKQGDAWSVAPNPIPVNYVTRAGFLWRSGEAYRLELAAGFRPGMVDTHEPHRTTGDSPRPRRHCHRPSHGQRQRGDP